MKRMVVLTVVAILAVTLSACTGSQGASSSGTISTGNATSSLPEGQDAASGPADTGSQDDASSSGTTSADGATSSLSEGQDAASGPETAGSQDASGSGTTSTDGAASGVQQEQNATESSGGGGQLPDDTSDTSLTFSSDDLGIAFDLPELLKGHSKILTDEREAYGETVDVVSVYYMEAPGQPDSDVHVLTIEVMSEGCWEQMQAEGGPLGTELGRSQDGRVAVMTTLQSNPFSETDEQYDLFNQLPRELGTVSESFRFLD